MLRYCFCFFSCLTVFGSFWILVQEFLGKYSVSYPDGPKKISGNSCVLANIIKRSSDDPDRITLVLHASSDRVDEDIFEHVRNWNAPVSLVVTFYNNETARDIGCLASYLRGIRANDSMVNEYLSVHFLIEYHSVNCNRLALETVESCDYEPRPIKYVTRLELAKKLMNYPINKARNLGRQYASTKFIVVADLGHFFSLNFEVKMRNLANALLESSPKTVLVYRLFETEFNATQPQTKADLKALMDSQEAFEFHHDSKDHSIEHLDEWFASAETEKNTTVQFFKNYTSPRWEPQVVSLPTIPLFDTAFRYPRRDNTVLRWELCRAGYEFAIIHDVFAYHRGLKSYGENNFLNTIRRRLGKSTTEAVDAFVDRMDLLYPDTSDKCPLLRNKSKREVNI